MTREEAVEIVKSAFSAWESEFRVPNDDWSEEHEALDMAIEALKRELDDDLISRADAIEALDDIASDFHMRRRLDEEYIASMCSEKIETLPSADRPRGEWLKVIDHDGILMEHYVCDKCGMLTTDCSNFCPNCGAKMDRGGDAE